MDVAAIIVTRGDQDLTQVWTSLPPSWERIEWNNAVEEDLGVYGRYAAIERTDAEIIYVQDDDAIVSNPAFLIETLLSWSPAVVVSNMPYEFRHGFYNDHALVGFGAAFHRDAPARAFAQFSELLPMEDLRMTYDIVFTGLTPRILVDVPHEDLPWAHHETRMWKQPGHQAERVRMLDLVRQVSVGSEQSTGR